MRKKATPRANGWQAWAFKITIYNMLFVSESEVMPLKPTATVKEPEILADEPMDAEPSAHTANDGAQNSQQVKLEISPTFSPAETVCLSG